MNAERKGPFVAALKVTYMEDADCEKEGGADNMLDVEIHGLPDADTAFLVISTERWAIDPDKIDEFAALLKEVYAKSQKPKPMTLH